MSVDRREFLRRTALTITGAGIVAHELQNAALATAAQTGLSIMARLENATSTELASQQEFYFRETGHHLSGDFLSFWRGNRNGHIFGLPITEEMVDGEGWKVQYFENVRLEQNPDDGNIQLGALGVELFNMGGRPIYEHESSLSYPPFSRFYKKYLIDFGLEIGGLSDSVQHTQRVGLLRKFKFDIMPERILEWMYSRNLENLRVLWPGEVTLVPLGRIIAEHQDVEVGGVPQIRGSLNFNPTMFNGQKRIDVDLTEQQLVAYEGNIPVLISPVATGRPGYETPVGNFRIGWRPEFLDYYSPFPERPYFQPHVPFNMGFAPMNFIHGTYWHDGFGKNTDYIGSMGCVNLDMYEASWLYHWTTWGTPVRIHR